MGILCCCFHVNSPEDDVSTCQNCICPNCIVHSLKSTAIFSKERSDAPTAHQVAAPLSSDAALRNIQSNNIVTSAPGILQFDPADAARSSQKQDEQIKEPENDQHEGRSTPCCSESQLNLSSEKSEAEVACTCELSEDEDVCPTCLEEYIPENPKIVLQCSHGYHLSCIYEWMERSQNCPICDKVMIFDEAT